MKLICTGEEQAGLVCQDSIDMYRDMFVLASGKLYILTETLFKYFGERPGANVIIYLA